MQAKSQEHFCCKQMSLSLDHLFLPVSFDNFSVLFFSLSQQSFHLSAHTHLSLSLSFSLSLGYFFLRKTDLTMNRTVFFLSFRENLSIDLLFLFYDICIFFLSSIHFWKIYELVKQDLERIHKFLNWNLQSWHLIGIKKCLTVLHMTFLSK